jgi:chemotaxis family two-component system response regulator Rcp1
MGSKEMPTDILLVEDNAGDVRLLQEVLFAANPGARIHVVRDGAEAIEFLTYQAEYLDVPRPSLILLDLELPNLHGHEVLQRVKSNPRVSEIPVVVLTASEAESDVVTSYQLGANCFLRKPGELDAFEGLVQSLNAFWLTRVKTPDGRRHMGLVDPSA